MQDVGLKAIIIGAAVFIAMITISVIMVYYSTARNIAVSFGSGGDYIGHHVEEVDTALKKNTISGVEVINIINYFAKNTSFRVDVINVKIPSENKVKTVEDINNKLELNDDVKIVYNSIRPASTYSLFKAGVLGGKEQFILTQIK